MKKVLSIFLALAMLISLIPAVFAADTEAEPEIKVVYNFKSDKFTALADNSDSAATLELNELTYAESKGFWQYAASSIESDTLGKKTSGIRANSEGYIYVTATPTEPDYWFAVKINVPKQGNYDISLTTYTTSTNSGIRSNTHINAFMFKADGTANIKDSLVIGNDYNLDCTNPTTSSKKLKIGTQSLETGEYYFVVNPYQTKNTTTNVVLYLQALTLTENGTGTALVPMISSIEEKTVEGGKAVEAKAELMSNAVDSAADAEIKYSVAPGYEDVATIDEISGVITPVTGGTATFIATATKDGLSSSKSIEVKVDAPAEEPDDNSELEEAFNTAFDAVVEPGVEYNAPTVTGVTVDDKVITSTPGTVTGAFNLTADEVNEDGKNFLYWAKAMTLSKKIISFSNELTNYMPGVNDKNDILIAVYEGDVPEQEEWYNANGQRIATETAPEEYPSMAGYGTAEGWDDYTDMKIHVARYARQTPTAGINVTVVDGNGGGTNLTYGNTVTCTADEEEYGTFKCWTKSDINGNTEIVSVDKVYTFQAWEDCTVTAMYNVDYTYNGNTMKIIIDAFTAGNEKAVMAEFIGFGNSAVEKGIIWSDGETTTKIAMTKPGTQFTLTGEAGDTFTGYAIVDNGDGTHSEVTDGSITITLD